ncbi:MAG: AMP-binding protein, partial [Planctomycetota bacterium]
MSPHGALIGRLHQHAREDPDRAALMGRSATVSYLELIQRIEAGRETLLRAGVTEQSIVAIESDDDLEHLNLCLSIASLGAASFTLATFEPAESKARLSARLGATHVASFRAHSPASIRSLDPSERANEVRLDVPNGESTILFATSGTTGEPKVVWHTDATLTQQAHRHVRKEERFACLASVEHNFAKRHRLYCLAEGATGILVDGSIDGAALEWLIQSGATTLHVTAFQARELLAVEGRERLTGIRLKLGGSHVPGALRERLRNEVSAE